MKKINWFSIVMPVVCSVFAVFLYDTFIHPEYKGPITHLYGKNIYYLVSDKDIEMPVDRDVYYRLNVGEPMNWIVDPFSEKKTESFPGQVIANKYIGREYYSNDSLGTVLDTYMDSSDYEQQLIDLLKPGYANVHTIYTRDGVEIIVDSVCSIQFEGEMLFSPLVRTCTPGY